MKSQFARIQNSAEYEESFFLVRKQFYNKPQTNPQLDNLNKWQNEKSIGFV
ncbi:unnamed protein product [Paramecium octaurelia]|uniref:Uncharacterized protein n=1 Tax=Paramecium octaurelia TaxID=43137 RepID=A0A8S1V0G6_PAROT|nr:unnamed protein product [Paramecium octaurelia]